MVPVLQTQRAKMTVKAKQEEVYKKYEGELKAMLGGLDDFLMKCSCAWRRPTRTRRTPPETR